MTQTQVLYIGKTYYILYILHIYYIYYILYVMFKKTLASIFKPNFKIRITLLPPPLSKC